MLKEGEDPDALGEVLFRPGFFSQALRERDEDRERLD